MTTPLNSRYRSLLTMSYPLLRKAVFVLALFLYVNAQAAPAESHEELLTRAKKAFSNGQKEEAAALATQAIRTDPKNPHGYYVRARIYEERKQPAKALADYDQVVKLDPKAPHGWQQRGIVHFKLARIAEAISDFDQYVKLKPADEPHHWQRGICYYYAGRFEDGRKQFELHRTVNPNDVENAVWHFLCVARSGSGGLEKARAALIPIREDARVPMMQIHALFAGQAKEEDVLQAANAGEPAAPELQRRRFYAHLYLGLYYEAIGEEAQSRKHVAKAVHDYAGTDYMSDVARVHLVLRETKKKP